MTDLVLGLDVGGTATRALVTTLEGARVGFGRASAGNPVTVPAAEVAANLTSALAGALDGVDPARIRSAVVGAAGASRPAVFRELLTNLGVRCQLRVVGDVVVAFAAGTRERDGTVLISGTGAVAAQISGQRMVRVADGLGWLLGDLGSGFWLGREAASATARALYRGTRPDTPAEPEPGPGEKPSLLVELVCEAVGERDPDAFVGAVHGRSPGAIASLAPLVTRAAQSGDGQALSIVDRAAGHLLATVNEVRAPGDLSPIVLSGSVLRHGLPLRDAVEVGLARRWPLALITVADDGEVGAARLAALYPA